MDILKWCYTGTFSKSWYRITRSEVHLDRLIPSARLLPPPFTQTECKALMAFLRSVNGTCVFSCLSSFFLTNANIFLLDTPSFESAVHSRTIAKIFLRSRKRVRLCLGVIRLNSGVPSLLAQEMRAAQPRGATERESRRLPRSSPSRSGDLPSVGCLLAPSVHHREAPSSSKDRPCAGRDICSQRCYWSLCESHSMSLRCTRERLICACQSAGFGLSACGYNVPVSPWTRRHRRSRWSALNCILRFKHLLRDLGFVLVRG